MSTWTDLLFLHGNIATPSALAQVLGRPLPQTAPQDVPASPDGPPSTGSRAPATPPTAVPPVAAGSRAPATPPTTPHGATPLFPPHALRAIGQLP